LFTKEAKKYVEEKVKSKAIILKGGIELVKLMLKNNIGFCSKKYSNEVKEINKEFLAKYDIGEE
jgi:restriction endonuclease Mrr